MDQAYSVGVKTNEPDLIARRAPDCAVLRYTQQPLTGYFEKGIAPLEVQAQQADEPQIVVLQLILVVDVHQIYCVNSHSSHNSVFSEKC